MDAPDCYLSSTDTYGLEKPRAVRRIKRIAVGHRDDALLAEVDPPIREWGARDIAVVVLASRHMGQSLFPVSQWPLAVHVAKPLAESVERRDFLEMTEVETIAWAELYRTEDEARRQTWT
jgi:hypothetical protein